MNKILYSFSVFTLVLSSQVRSESQSDLQIRFPTKIVCQFADPTKVFFFDNDFKVIYTRLEKIRSRSQLNSDALSIFGIGSRNAEEPKSDEVALAPWSGGYYSASISATEFKYDVWSCDSEDRFYTFNTNDLIMDSSSKMKSRMIEAKVRIEVREEGEDYKLLCKAQY